MSTTIGIKEALIEYLQDHVLGKELTKRQVGQIEKLFVEDDRIDKAIDFCYEKLNEDFVPTLSYTAAFAEMVNFLQSIK